MSALTTELLQQFVGGQFEIRKGDGYIYRGKIRSIEVGTDLVITFEWVAKGAVEGRSRVPDNWALDTMSEFKYKMWSVMHYTADGGGVSIRENGSIMLMLEFCEEHAFLLPAGHSLCVDPSDVEGLEQPQS